MSCTIIKSSDTITGVKSERVSSLKKMIEDIYLPYSTQKVGDVAMYDSTNDKIVFASADADFLTDYPASQFTPIGVVAIPNDHRTASGMRVVTSLKYMNYTTPDEGSVDSQNIYWGYNSLLLGDAMDVAVYAGTCNAPSSTASGTNSAVYLPSDNFTTKICPTDSMAYYDSSSSSYYAAPSPYLEDGSRNPVYYLTESPSSEANCLSDFDGIGKTQLMLDNVTVSDWQTAETITNSYGEGNYPAACCCWRYHTAGTSQGDWYLPAMGELGYIMARLKTINATIANLITAYGSEIGSEISTSAYLWSSTEYSSSFARSVYASYGSVTSSNKDHSCGVRAFARL